MQQSYGHRDHMIILTKKLFNLTKTKSWRFQILLEFSKGSVFVTDQCGRVVLTVERRLRFHIPPPSCRRCPKICLRCGSGKFTLNKLGSYFSPLVNNNFHLTGIVWQQFLFKAQLGSSKVGPTALPSIFSSKVSFKCLIYMYSVNSFYDKCLGQWV